jgi:hypothetical protein
MCSSSRFTAAVVRSSPKDSAENYSKWGPKARSGDYTQRPLVLLGAARIWREKQRQESMAVKRSYTSARHEAHLPAQEA